MPYFSCNRDAQVLLFCVFCEGVDCSPVAELSPDSMLSWLLLHPRQANSMSCAHGTRYGLIVSASRRYIWMGHDTSSQEVCDPSQ